MKSIKDVRKAAAKSNKYAVFIRLNDTDDEKVAEILEQRGIRLTAYVNELVRNELRKTGGSN